MTLSQDRIAELLAPYLLQPLGTPESQQLSEYLDLLMKWNGKVSLTSVREPERILQRHFGESLFLAQHMPACDSLLDFGSGAGLPGLPLQIVRPTMQVLLAESQQKKVAFLREVIRALCLGTKVWPQRMELMPADQRFAGVTMRAVERSEAVLATALARVRPGGWLALFRAERTEAVPQGYRWRDHRTLDVPGSKGRWLLLWPE